MIKTPSLSPKGLTPHLTVEYSAPFHVIGLMSGTSVDGIDGAFVQLSGGNNDLKVRVIRCATYPYSEPLRNQILQVCAGKSLTAEEWSILDDAIARAFADAAIKLQSNWEEGGEKPKATLIGSHGQTVFHRPPSAALNDLGYSTQLGRGELIAHLTQIPTVSNFRAADIAIKGHGAPLVPRVDAYLLSHPQYHRCVQNIGGIGNVTYLPPRSPLVDSPLWEHQVRGWDTGPGNVLIDLAIHHFSAGRQTYDENGAWAATGQPCGELIHQWLQDDFFQLSPPKSTGREQFGFTYWQRCLEDGASHNLSPADLLATLTDFTAATIAQSYFKWLPTFPSQVLVCGGGSRNAYLVHRLGLYLSSPRLTINGGFSQFLPAGSSSGVGETGLQTGSMFQLLTTDQVGIPSDFKEAIAFAILAYWKSLGLPGNLPSVTGAVQAIPLGTLHLPSNCL